MHSGRLTFIVLFIVSGIMTAYTQSLDYKRISMQTADFEAVRNWIDADHIHQENGLTVLELSNRTVNKLEERGLPFTVLVEDLTSFYRTQNRKLHFRSESGMCENSNYHVPENFKLGSMGGYLTLEELKMELNKMHKLYPNLITKARPISDFKTYEGRSIIWTSISGQGVESEKEEVLYTALHHAREPMSMQQMVYFMWYVLENYDSDPAIKSLLDKTKLYFIPCVNPDGYAYNAKISPEGGGMWRKNRRPVSKDKYGVDLNRNYGYEWGFNGSGSSNDPASDLYRGPKAFSETETKAVKWFCENHNISTALNYHSFGDYLIYPWGYTQDVTSNDAEFKSLARSLSFEKRILYGTSRETVLYTTNGDADDWMYGETNSKNRIYSMTPEVGPAEYGFWPPRDQIERLCARELNQNIRMAMAPHGFVFMVPSGNPVIYTTSLKHRFYLYPVTMEDGVVQSKIKPLTDNILSYQESLYFFGLGNNEEYQMDLQLKPEMEDGELIQFVITLDNGKLTSSDTVTYIYATKEESIDVLSRSTDIDNWVRSSQSSNSWGSTKTEYYTQPSCITDSPHGLYSTSTENSMVSSESYRVPREEEVFLTFKAKWDITYGEDFAQLSISTDGVHFTPVCGQLTTDNFNYKGEVSPVYTGIQNEWLTERISLNNYKGKDVYFKWNMVSQSAEARDGIFVDDMKITYSQTITSSGGDILPWQGYKLYPNPVSGGILNVDLGDGITPEGVDRYEVRNQLGQMIDRNSTTSGVNHINVLNYPAGIYYLNLITTMGQQVEARKFVVLP